MVRIIGDEVIGMEEIGLAFLDHMEASGERLRKLNIFSSVFFSLASTWGRSLLFVVIGLLLFLLPRYQPISNQDLVTYLLVLLYMRAPLLNFMSSLPRLARANVVLSKIERLGLRLDGSDQPDPTTLERIVPDGRSWQKLELQQVSFPYDRKRKEGPSFVLGPLSFTMRAGELIFLVGGNGSGKTTLAKLLIGLYKPFKGKILLDGQPVTPRNRESYRELFSTVFSEFFLFETLLGLDQNALDDKARRYLKLLKLDHKVEVENGQLSTTKLSRGQRKRLALFTAYLEDRPIYIFDEWAADQDPIFRAFFYEELLPELRARGKTVLAITHDDRYFHLADRILKLEVGQLVEDRPVVKEEVAIR